MTRSVFCRMALASALASALATVALPALALYKIVGPDGSVTYTDRPPAGTTSRVNTLVGGTVNEVTPLDTLPIELRQAAVRYPVVLYTSADCAPCDAGRQLLVQRGIPYTEKLIVNNDDAAALELAVGTRSVPALMIGSQALRGMSADEWIAYLDAARYPRESRLPRGWQSAVPEPLVVRSVARPAAPPVPAAPLRAPLAPEPPAAPATGLRF
jgi:glutaredoxin